MNIKQAKQEIKNTVNAYLLKDGQGEYMIPEIRQRPILLMGPPGIGKTQIMEQIARECRIGLVSYTITHHTRQSAVGLPFIREEEFGGKKYSVTEYTMSEIIASVYRVIQTTGLKEGILFIDEINCVSETLAPTMLQFLQCKTFGNQKIPNGWLIVAAGNPPEYNKSVREFDMVTLDRVRKIEVEADFAVWKEYAKSVSVENALISYLQLRPKNFYRIETDVDGMRFVTARGWEDLSSLIKVYAQLEIPVTEDVILEYLQHEEVAKDVSAYLDLYKKYQDNYGIEQILNGNVSPDIYARLDKASFDERLSVVNLLLSGLNGYFRTVAELHYIADKWYAFLKDYQKRIQQSSHNLYTLYAEMVNEVESRLMLEQKSGFLAKEERIRIEKFCRYLKAVSFEEKESATDVAENSVEEKESAFDMARASFEELTAKLEQMEEETLLALEHAFLFVEQAFRTGSEMVVFVTELTMGAESAAFLAENECEKYLQYNKELMVGTKKAELLSALQEDSIREQEHMTDF
ncbi:MAG: ATP-binding protein [Lachnospiraceae bacterium]|nr:ATP-binding protein [Lachnospiraceae bacterium]